jgi:hypothetical protein
MKGPPDPYARVARLAWLLDNAIAIPGTRLRIGFDALIGLVPGIGDLVGVLLSSYIVAAAWRMGVPRSTLMHMGANILIEGFVGAIPLAGDLFDAAWKANARNVALLRAHAADPRRAARTSRWFIAGLFACLVLAVSIIGALVYGIVRWLAA